MTLDEAIKHAEEVANEKERFGAMGRGNPDKYAPSPEQCFKCAEEHRQLAEWLKELKRVRELPWLKELKRLREQTRWILCSERLPKRDEIVLVSYRGEVHFCKYLDDGSENTWWDYIYDSCIWNNDIVAWMPLPEPYKKEGEAE